MIEKPKRPKKLNNQDRKIPASIQELINRYDLENNDVYDFLDYLVNSFNNETSEIETKTEKNIITAKGSSGEIATTSSEEKLTMSTSVSVGDKLTLTNDGGIKIGAGITKVAISGSTTYTSSTASQHALLIYKNSKIDANKLARVLFNCNTGIGIQPTINIPYQIVPVNENDILYLYASSSANKNVSGAMSYMTVEVID